MTGPASASHSSSSADSSRSSDLTTDATRERAREGLDHLQAAARELIEAARAALDVAESLIDDPEVLSTVLGTVGRLGDVVRAAASHRSTPFTRTNGAEGTEYSGSDPTDSRVQRITIH